MKHGDAQENDSLLQAQNGDIPVSLTMIRSFISASWVQGEAQSVAPNIEEQPRYKKPQQQKPVTFAFIPASSAPTH